MALVVHSAVPPINETLRDTIYTGHIYKLPTCSASLAIVEDLRSMLGAVFGSTLHPQEVQFHLSNTEFFAKIGEIRSALSKSESALQKIAALLKSTGFSIEENIFDILRLRAVVHAGHQNPEAAPAYSAHRDTWYANPQTQINWWIPIYDVGLEEGFCIYPHYFSRQIKNSSAQFNYAEWIKTVGWQNYSKKDKNKQYVYPSTLEPISTPSIWKVELKAGEILIFSAAHLHQTLPNNSGKTRYSVDFRTVHKQDSQTARAAPNVDNLSTGSAAVDYRSFVP